MATFSQNPAEKIKKLSNDSANKSRAAKADVYIVGKPVFEPAMTSENAAKNNSIERKIKSPATKREVKRKRCLYKIR